MILLTNFEEGEHSCCDLYKPLLVKGKRLKAWSVYKALNVVEC